MRNVSDDLHGVEDPHYPGVMHWTLLGWPGELIHGPAAAVVAYLQSVSKARRERGIYVGYGHDLLGGLAYVGRSLVDLVPRVKKTAYKPGCAKMGVFLSEDGRPVPPRTDVVHCERWFIKDYKLIRVDAPKRGGNVRPGENHGGSERQARYYYEGMRVLLSRLNIADEIAAAQQSAISVLAPTGPVLHLCSSRSPYSAFGYRTTTKFIVLAGAKLADSPANQNDVKSGWAARKLHKEAGRVMASQEPKVWGVTTQPITFDLGPNSGLSVPEDFVTGTHRPGSGWKVWTATSPTGCPRCGATVAS